MTHWMCNRCGYYQQSAEPAEKCPGCGEVCVFMDVTCYRPECGGERNIDPLLVGAALGNLTGPKVKPVKAEGALTKLETFTQAQIMRGMSDPQKNEL